MCLLSIEIISMRCELKASPYHNGFFVMFFSIVLLIEAIEMSNQTMEYLVLF